MSTGLFASLCVARCEALCLKGKMGAKIEAPQAVQPGSGCKVVLRVSVANTTPLSGGRDADGRNCKSRTLTAILAEHRVCSTTPKSH
eukprot:6669675-Prymnesium_polylepis.1